MPSHHKGPPREILALTTYIKLVRATDSVTTRIFRRGTCGALTPSQFAVIEALYHLGPLRQRDIGSKLLKSGGNITLIIDNLEKQGLVRRERSAQDRRNVMVSLSPLGRKLIGRIFPAHVAAIVDELGVLTPDEQRALGALCKKLGKRDKPAE
jgi:MarR family 2-MHQ and catechol resistance regulon transcriptional repressor